MSGKIRDDYFDTGHLDENIGQRTMRGGALTAVAQAVKSIVEVVSTVVLVRLLLPEEFGLVGMVASVTGFLAMFKDLGLSMATIQRAQISHAQVSTLFWINLGFSALIMLMTIGMAPALVWFFDEPRLLWVTIGLSGAFLFGGLTVQHEALLRRQMRFGAIAIIQSVAMVISVVVAIVLAWQGWSYWALVARSVVSAIVTAAGVWLMCSWRPGMWSRDPEIKSLLGFGGNLTGFNFVNYFARNLDDILIGRFYGSASLGVYQKAYEIFMIPLTLINTPISAVAIPALSRLVHDEQRYRAAYLRILEKVLMIAMPLGALLIGASDWIVLLVLGEQWTAATGIISMLGVAIFVQVVGNSTGWLFITQDRTREMMKWGLISTALAAASFLVGLPWGALGVAAAYSLMDFFIRTPLLLWYVGRRGPVKAGDVYRLWGPFFAVGMAVLAALRGVRLVLPVENMIVGLGLSIVVAAVVTLLGLSLTRTGRGALADGWGLSRRMISKRGKV